MAYNKQLNADRVRAIISLPNQKPFLTEWYASGNELIRAIRSFAKIQVELGLITKQQAHDLVNKHIRHINEIKSRDGEINKLRLKQERAKPQPDPAEYAEKRRQIAAASRKRKQEKAAQTK